MSQLRPREARRTVRLKVRVRTETGWIDATVQNLSQRGMSLHSPLPLRRNQYVEIARGRCRVVGRIVWSDHVRCGIRAQDAVDIAGFLSNPQAGLPPCANDRRAMERTAPPPPTGQVLSARVESSRSVGRAFEFGVILAGIACTAALAIGSVFEVLGTPLEQVGSALAPAPN